MHPDDVVLFAIIGVVVLFAVLLVAAGLVVGYRRSRDHGHAMASFAARRGFQSRPDPENARAGGSATVLLGMVDGVRVGLRNVLRGSSGSLTSVTRVQAWAVPAPPDAFVAYTPSFRYASGGQNDSTTILDDPTEAALVGIARDDVIGDPALDAVLAIHADPQGMAAAILRSPPMKQAVLDAVARIRHLRIVGGNVVSDFPREATRDVEMEERVREVVRVARALGAAVATLGVG